MRVVATRPLIVTFLFNMINTPGFEYISIKASLNLCEEVITVLMHCEKDNRIKRIN